MTNKQIEQIEREIENLKLKVEELKKEERKPEAGDFIEIDDYLCLLVDKNEWKMDNCKGKLAVVLLKDGNENDWFELAYGYQRDFEEGYFKYISKDKALRRLAK